MMGNVLAVKDKSRTRPSLARERVLWNAAHVSEEQTPLQDFIRAALAAAPRARDHYDKQIQDRMGRKGKPLYDIQRGKSRVPSMSTLAAIAEVLDQPQDLLLRAAGGERVWPANASPEADQQPTVSSDGGETVGIQKLDLSLSMGPGTVIGDYVEAEKVELDLALVRSITRAPTDRLRLVTGHGHSMEPTLQGNDMILIDTTDRLLARQDAIYWIDLFGAAGLKRLRTVAKDRVLIISDNPAVDNQEVAAEDLRIDGRAIWFARGL